MTDKATDHKEANVPEELKHGLNCAAWTNSLGFEVNAEECTCGLRYRDRISTLTSELAEARQTIAKRDALLDQMSANNDTLRIELAAEQKTIERLSAPVSGIENMLRDMCGFPRKGREPDYINGRWCIKCHNSLPEEHAGPCDVCGYAPTPIDLSGLLVQGQDNE